VEDGNYLRNGKILNRRHILHDSGVEPRQRDDKHQEDGEAGTDNDDDEHASRPSPNQRKHDPSYHFVDNIDISGEQVHDSSRWCDLEKQQRCVDDSVEHLPQSQDSSHKCKKNNELTVSCKYFALLSAQYTLKNTVDTNPSRICARPKIP
jgi:hypothetical protein